MSNFLAFSEAFPMPSIEYPRVDKDWGTNKTTPDQRHIMVTVRDSRNNEFFRLYETAATISQRFKTYLYSIACEFGNLEIATFMVQEGADVNGLEYQDYHPMMYALKTFNLELVDWMLTLPDIDPNCHMDCGGYNALAFAIENNYPMATIQAMINCGAEISEEYGGFYPLSMAAHKANIPAIALLLAYDADPHYIDSDNQSVAYYAPEALKSAIEQWTPQATMALTDMLAADGFLIYKPTILFDALAASAVANN